ncbi:PE-PPE domain-containing protein [Mycobacterium paraense]|uniref:PE-PPE domain-containing protein n=1 Tax=Mycobacterium paraense TaxID=767916 RepID=UPI000A146BD4|nr:PE-PPE domain-containing protein [Mycobacterium paraense]MCV7444657.1 PE-PPE domain-containing protein [Mycobacterium paraense]
MSYVLATPELLTSAAEDLARIGSVVDAANAAAANSTTSLLAAGADEVSTGIASLFGAHAVAFQALTAQAADLQERFALTLAANANTYLTSEMTTAQTLLARQSIPGAAAGTRITVPGAGPLYYPNFITELPYLGQLLYAGSIPGPISVSILQGYDLLNHAIGQNWFPGTTPQVVNYPASIGIISGSLAAPGVNDAIAMGQRALNDQIMNAFTNGNGLPVRIAALSEGTLVVNRELAALAADPTAPPHSALQFAMFNGPETGLFHIYLPNGFTVPFVDYTAQGVPNTQYDVSVVFGQYDFFGNPPDRPWDIPAWVNSLAAGIYNHNTTSLVSMSDAVQVSSSTSSLGGTVTTYMVPSPTLPMLFPLEQLGVPQPIVNGLNAFLQPIVNDGYSSLTPNAGPYFLQGSLQGLPPLPNLFW